MKRHTELVEIDDSKHLNGAPAESNDPKDEPRDADDESVDNVHGMTLETGFGENPPQVDERSGYFHDARDAAKGQTGAVLDKQDHRKRTAEMMKYVRYELRPLVFVIQDERQIGKEIPHDNLTSRVHLRGRDGSVLEKRGKIRIN